MQNFFANFFYKKSRTTVVRSSIFDNSLYTVDKKILVKRNESISLNFYFNSTFNKKTSENEKYLKKFNKLILSFHYDEFSSLNFLKFSGLLCICHNSRDFSQEIKKNISFTERKINNMWKRWCVCLPCVFCDATNFWADSHRHFHCDHLPVGHFHWQIHL